MSSVSPPNKSDTGLSEAISKLEQPGGGTEDTVDSSLNEAPKLDVNLVAGYLLGFSQRAPELCNDCPSDADREMLRAGSDWIRRLLRDGQPARRAE